MLHHSTNIQKTSDTVDNEIIEVIIYANDILSASTTMQVGSSLIKLLRDEYGEVNEAKDTSTEGLFMLNFDLSF